MKNKRLLTPAYGVAINSQSNSIHICFHIWSCSIRFSRSFNIGKNGKNGRGKQTWPNGRVYNGEFKDDKMNGRGNMTWPNGKVYEGEFKDDNMHGRGKLMTPDGKVYEGEFKDDKKHGRGKLTSPDGSTVYEGEWEEDKIKQ